MESNVSAEVIKILLNMRMTFEQHYQVEKQPLCEFLVVILGEQRLMVTENEKEWSKSNSKKSTAG